MIYPFLTLMGPPVRRFASPHNKPLTDFEMSGRGIFPGRFTYDYPEIDIALV